MRETGRHGEKIRPARKILPPRLHKASFERLDSKQTQTQGGSDVVKGVSHRVIVVKSPDKYFEEAIFVIREDVLQARGADSASVMFISSVQGLNLIAPPDNDFFTKRSSQAVNDVTTFLAGQEKPSLVAVSTGVYSTDGGHTWDNDFTKHTARTAKCMILNTGHDYAFKNGQNAMVYDLSK